MDRLSDRFQVTDFSCLPGWADDDVEAAFAAFRRSAFHSSQKPYRSGSLGIGARDLASAFAAACAGPIPPGSARSFFETRFLPARIRTPEGEHGFVTGFYEPVLEASLLRTDRFRVPLLHRPDDLVEVGDRNRPAGVDPALSFGRSTASGIVEYFDRGEIDRGALAERDLALAWVEDPVDAYFVHVQGAARLRIPDGSTMRITYAAKSGHPFTGAGRILAELGELPLAEVTMQSIRAWFKRNPERVNEILWRNRSYIFFREAPVSDPELGPVAAAKVSLTAGRSIAVDRLLHTFGTPFFIDAPSLKAFDDRPFQRLMIAQDTGSAIVGAARGDLFAGPGDAAGEIAGVIRHPADFYVLLPRALLERRAA